MESLPQLLTIQIFLGIPVNQLFLPPDQPSTSLILPEFNFDPQPTVSVYLNSVQENSQTTLIGRKQAWNQEDGALTIETRFGQNRELMYHTGGTAMTSGLTLDIGQWYQIIFTQDANYHASFYVNGRLLKNQIITAEQTAMGSGFFPVKLLERIGAG